MTEETWCPVERCLEMGREMVELDVEIQQLKDKIDFYEGELIRRGYVIPPEE